MKRQMILALAATVLGAAAAHAQTPVMDGTKDAAYGAALSLQNTNTQFGNGTNGDPINGGGGSEIDGVYAKIVGDRLYLMVTGNLETNFNKLDIFVDSKAGGINQINSATLGGGTGQPNHVHNNGNLPGGVDPFSVDQPDGGFAPPFGTNSENNGALQRMNGLTFDTGFTADYYLTVTHGYEGNIGGSGIQAYAASAHYADLTNGAAGATHGLGMQLAQRGLPNVLRGSTADSNRSGAVEGSDFLAWQQFYGTATGATRAQGDSSGATGPDGAVNDADYAFWASKFGFTAGTSTLTDNFYTPQSGDDDSNILLGPALPDLVQGQLIDQDWVAAHPGFAAPEVKMALAPITANNPENYRDLKNIIDLRMAIDNSNIAGVSGAGPYTDATLEDVAAVSTGVEMSMPLSAIGNPASTSEIRLTIFVNGGNHAYLSNQFGGTGILDVNPGGDEFGNFIGDLSQVNMNDYAGDQFVALTVPATAAGTGVPEPTGATLVVMAALSLAARRRR